MPDIKLSNIYLSEVGSTFADLHGPTVKAAQTRCLMPWIADLAEKHFASSSQHDKSIRKVTRSISSFIDVLYSVDFFLTEDQKAEVQVLLYRFGRHFCWLSGDATEAGVLVWHLRPKLHFMQHLAEQCRLINPRYVQCYLEESICGKMAALAKSCFNGPKLPKKLQYLMLLKYLCAIWARSYSVVL